MIVNIFRKKQNYNKEEINLKHNLWRIENDLNWIFYQDVENSFDIKICLYWLDINLKNTIFPWVLKIERELKSYFIYYYKEKFKTSNSDQLLNLNNYTDLDNSKNPLKIFEEYKDMWEKTIDEVVFSLTFGQFVNLLIFFHPCIKSRIAHNLDMDLSVFINIIKYFNILRNAVAHNKTIIKIRDDKNNKRFSLKKKYFDFPIKKDEIDIISTNASGAIYVVKTFLARIDKNKKSKIFIKDVKRNFRDFYAWMNNKKEYKKIMKLIFLKYEKEIFQI